MSKYVRQPAGFRAASQTHVEWQTFVNSENKRQMYGSQSTQALMSYK